MKRILRSVEESEDLVRSILSIIRMLDLNEDGMTILSVLDGSTVHIESIQKRPKFPEFRQISTPHHSDNTRFRMYKECSDNLGPSLYWVDYNPDYKHSCEILFRPDTDEFTAEVYDANPYNYELFEFPDGSPNDIHQEEGYFQNSLLYSVDEMNALVLIRLLKQYCPYVVECDLLDIAELERYMETLCEKKKIPYTKEYDLELLGSLIKS